MHRTLSARHKRFVLKQPFRIARGVKTAADVITVEITSGTSTGRGEGVPYGRYGESIEGVLAQIETARSAIEAGADRNALQALLQPGAARNAIDCALWDLEARESGIGVSSRLGDPPLEPIRSALTIGIDTPAEMAQAATRLALVPLLKVKVDSDDPAAKIRAVRNAAPCAALIVDPNESWDEALVRQMAAVLVECRVDVLEQPVPAGEDGWLAGYVSPVPICADESVHVIGDLEFVATCYDAVNVKLDKAGGLTAALALAHATRERGLKLMSGCMVCSSLGIAPALHIARMADWADLDGPIWLLEDRTGGVRDADGRLFPPIEGFWG